jgi:thermolysin
MDAHDGRVVLHYDAMNHAYGTSYYSGTVPIETTYALLSDGKYMYRLWDKTRAMYTTDMLGSTTATGGVFSNTTNVWGNTYPYRETAGVDAHFGVTKAWDYFRAKQGWTGINGSGEGVVSRVHYGTGAAGNDASANGSTLTFGSGDGVTTKPWVSTDVVAHEYTHAVVTRTANLTYYGYSGALNESFADIFGTAVEFYTGIRPDYLIAEDIGRTLRSLENPRLYGQPDHFTQYVWTSDDNAGVHINSGIPNKAFYLLAQGGTHPSSGVKVSAIGRPAAEWIFFRALRKLTPNANFSAARVATLSAAADGYGLYSGAWYSVKAAWDAVGVY